MEVGLKQEERDEGRTKCMRGKRVTEVLRKPVKRSCWDVRERDSNCCTSEASEAEQEEVQAPQASNRASSRHLPLSSSLIHPSLESETLLFLVHRGVETSRADWIRQQPCYSQAMAQLCLIGTVQWFHFKLKNTA